MREDCTYGSMRGGRSPRGVPLYSTCQQMANMRGERNGECDNIRNV